ncbi:hypothetical protein ACPPVO_21565 [Dactylosporangium sp. McL0621]|uniref:hypothetical protein n=1 Tax=Dactylosporangium sp. McL0621 TaxID=3415678 RepID=UPI003CF38259
MSSATVAAVIAASAGLLGALLASAGTYSVERFRAHAALREKAQERQLASIEAFLLATHAWHDFLVLVGELGWTQNDSDRINEMDRRVLQRDQAYRRLLLLSSPRLYRWLTETYAPVEYEVRRTYVHQIRFENHVDDGAKQARRAYSKLIREDLPEVARADLTGLRDARRLADRRP